MNDVLIPHFRDRNYSEGIKQGAIALDKLARVDLSYLMDRSKIFAAVLVITLANALVFMLLITNIGKDNDEADYILAGSTGFFYLGLFALYYFGVLNHVEFLITAASCLTFTLIFFSIYGYLHARAPGTSDTGIVLVKLFAIMIFGVLALLFFLLEAFGNHAEFGDGDADFGGGATGGWD